jgi:hypothetical protein
VGNIISGSARDKNTLDWLEKYLEKLSKNPIPNLFLSKEQLPVLTRKWTI